MSYLSEELERQMQAQRIDQTKLAEIAGMSQGQISHWRNGRQKSISPEQMVSLQKALSREPLDNAALICAHLRDEIFGLHADLVRIELDQPLEFRDRPARQTKGERAVAYLAELRIRSKDTNDLLVDLARCLGADI